MRGVFIALQIGDAKSHIPVWGASELTIRELIGSINTSALTRHVDVTGLYLWLLFLVRLTKSFVARGRGSVGVTARRRLCGCRCRH